MSTSLIHWFLVVFGMIKLLEIMKVQQKMGQTVKLVEAVMVDIVGFVLFFLFWVIIFSLLHRILGFEVDKDHSRYFRVSKAHEFFLHTWIFSTGGGPTSPPNYDIWYSFDDNSHSIIMIYVMWFNQIMNQFYVNKILLSMVIAIIGKTYKGQMAVENINLYQSRATLNAKCSVMMDVFGLLNNETDLIILSANYKTQ